jgi:hypothetical protein
MCIALLSQISFANGNALKILVKRFFAKLITFAIFRRDLSSVMGAARQVLIQSRVRNMADDRRGLAVASKITSWKTPKEPGFQSPFLNIWFSRDRATLSRVRGLAAGADAGPTSCGFS